jgi:divalent metal cation (Fe/Co/Zn/Cd) transporter
VGARHLIDLVARLLSIVRKPQELPHGVEREAKVTSTSDTLAAYVVIAAGWKLWTQAGQTFSWPGLIVTLLAMPVMYALARQKITVAEALGSRAMRADAMESVTCGWLSLVVVVGLLAQGLTGTWWVDSMASLGIVWFLVKEGREAWTGEDGCCD